MSPLDTIEAPPRSAEPLPRDPDPRRVLATIPPFRALPPPEIDRLAGRVLLRRFAHGRLIFGRGDPGDCLYVVLQGQVRLGATSSDGREVLFRLVGPGEVFGELALLDDKARSADAIAVGSCLLAAIDRRDLMPLLHATPTAWVAMLTLVCERLRVTSERFEGTAVTPVAGRLARLLLSLGNPVRLPQGDLGRLIGASRGQVNRHLRRWEKEGLLTQGVSGLRVLDAERLESIAE